MHTEPYVDKLGVFLGRFAFDLLSSSCKGRTSHWAHTEILFFPIPPGELFQCYKDSNSPGQADPQLVQEGNRQMSL
jgi:hypothetical protein